MAIIGGGCLALVAWMRSIGREDGVYRGYFSGRFSMDRLIKRIDPAVKIEGSGGGGGASTGDPYMTDYIHLLSSERPISRDLVDSLREAVLAEAKNAGVSILGSKDIAGGDSNYPANGVRFTTWGFQILYDDHGWKGSLTLRLTTKSIKDLERLGHKGEISENIAVFARR